MSTTLPDAMSQMQTGTGQRRNVGPCFLQAENQDAGGSCRVPRGGT